MNNDIDRLRSAVSIDPLRLDEQLVELPTLLMEAMEGATEATAKRDLAKHDLAVAQAVCADDLRHNSPSKLSEERIKSELMLNNAVQEASIVLIDCDRELGMWKAVCDSLRTKSSSMKQTAELIVAGYMAPNSAYYKRRADVNAVRTERRRELPTN